MNSSRQRHADSGSRRVLVVDDDAAVRKAVRLTCEAGGYDVEEAGSGTAALESVGSVKPDIVLLDLMMPDLGGFDVCRRLRSAGHRMPVVILSARTEEIDVVLGLEIGADDYVIKPFRPRELLARLSVHLRRGVEAGGPVPPDERRLVFRDLAIDIGERSVVRGDSRVTLTHTEFELLAYLAVNAGRALSRDQILHSVWGYAQPMETRLIDVHVRNLRRKIEEDPGQPRHILSVPGIGYRFTASRP